jgi:lipoprotein-anchoring transpeptidase ErfK/SrfK
MQRDPWWIPPPNSAWAAGEKPIPPGPGNPLGTRWMGLSAPAVGIHGTPDAASIGYSASHGCIRMRVPDAEWLFEHVRVGTPVAIVDA